MVRRDTICHTDGGTCRAGANTTILPGVVELGRRGLSEVVGTLRAVSIVPAPLSVGCIDVGIGVVSSVAAIAPGLYFGDSTVVDWQVERRPSGFLGARPANTDTMWRRRFGVGP